MEIIILLSLIVCILLVFTVFIYKKLNTIEKDLNISNEAKARLESDLKSTQQQLIKIEDSKQTLESKIELLTKESNILNEGKIKAESELKKELEKKDEVRTILLNEIEKQTKEILNNTAKEAKDLQDKSLDEILKPLRANIESFNKEVKNNNEKLTEAKTALSKDMESMQKVLKLEIENMQKATSNISSEASNLTKALTSNGAKSNKTQGNWGEMQLELILQNSGLEKDRSYKTQFNFKNDDEKRLIPDAVVFLPDNKAIVIDSKVSLKDYMDYTSSKDDDIKNTSLKKHIDSIKAHIKGLSGKDYAHHIENRSLDFVLMFIPIEGAFLDFVKNDFDDFNQNISKKIMLVSPSTLIMVLKIIESIWRFENQSKNAENIAKEAGSMLDKFEGFLESFEKIGTNLEQSKKAFDKSLGQLSTGNGNLVSKARKLEEMGAKASKANELNRRLESLENIEVKAIPAEDNKSNQISKSLENTEDKGDSK